jgi:hypothetical protein
MYHLLTGGAPFKGTSPGAIMSAHLTEPVPDPGELVPSLAEPTRRLVMMAMAKPVADRFRSFDAMIKAIDEAMQAQHEKDGAMRLLRKPLVIAKKPVAKKPGTDAHANDLPNAVNITERIAKKHGEALQTGRIAKDVARPVEPGDRVGLVKGGPVATARIAKLKEAPKPIAERIEAIKEKHKKGSGRVTNGAATATAATAGPVPSVDVGEASAFRALTERKPETNGAAAAGGVTDETFNLRPSEMKNATQALTKGHEAQAAPAKSKSQQLMAARLASAAQPTTQPATEGAKRSAVFDEDPDAGTGFGVLPWTVLALTIAIAIGFAIWHLAF